MPLTSSLHDLRHGVLLLRRDARTSALIVLVLALGIGGNAAIFTLLKAAFLDPLPYPGAARLVAVTENNGWIPSTSEFVQLRARTRTLEHIAFAEHLDMQLAGAAEPVRVFAARVTAGFLPLLGIHPALGRALLEEDNQPGRTPSVILSDRFWHAHFGADPRVLGRTLRLDGRPAIVAGVLPPGRHFDYPSLRIAEPVDIYVAYPLDPAIPLRTSVNGLGVPVRVIARLRPGVSLAQAQADARDLARVLIAEHPESFPTPPNRPRTFSFTVQPLHDAITGAQRPLLWLLLTGVAVLLLIACANTAQLLLARGLRRAREVAIRSALGAGRLRLIRQFLLEGLVLALCGGAAGLLAAAWIARLLAGLLPGAGPLLASARPDARVAAFTLAVSLLSALAFATIPAVKGSRWTPGPGLGTRAAAAEGNRWRHAILAVEAALSVFLLSGAGLIAQNLWTLTASPMGFDPRQVLAMRLQLPGGKLSLPDRKAGQTLNEYLAKIQAIPGVESAATVTGPPLRMARGGGPVELIGVTDGAGAPRRIPRTWTHQISPDYFRTLRIPLLAGRTFGPADAGEKITVAIVNEEFARRFGMAADIVGKQIADPGGPITIIGMVGTVRTRNLEAAAWPECYLSFLQFSWPNVHLVVRSALPPAQLVPRIKAAIQSSNADQSVYGIQTMDELISESLSQPRFNAFLIGAFALLAVAMAAAGMYSVISCLVAQRTAEIAIRIALGAGRGHVARAILAPAGLWASAGLAAGVALALATRATLRSLSSTAAQGSPWMYAAVALFFLAVVFAAAAPPVRRASRLDPAAALRSE